MNTGTYPITSLIINQSICLILNTTNSAVQSIFIEEVPNGETTKMYRFMKFNVSVFFIPSPTKLRRDIVTLPSVRPSFLSILVNTLESTSFNGFWPNKLDAYLVLKKIWNPINFQGQRSRGQIFRRGDTPRFALPLLFLFSMTFCNEYFVCLE